MDLSQPARSPQPAAAPLILPPPARPALWFELAKSWPWLPCPGAGLAFPCGEARNIQASRVDVSSLV